MKKIAFILLAGLTIASCSRDVDVQTTDDNNLERITIRTSGEISGELHAMNEDVTINGKNMATPISYGYKAFAEGPANLKWTDDRVDPSDPSWQGTSQLAQATAIFAVDDFLFVTWHLEDELYGGAVSVYEFDSNTDTYTYIQIAEFEDTDWHELSVTKNSLTGFYEIFLAGQRCPNSSNYILSDHKGAVVGKLLFNYITDQFDVGTYKELPLPGHGANDIVAYSGDYFVVTGNGAGGGAGGNQFGGGGVYKTDYALTNVSEADFMEDVMIIDENPYSLGIDPITIINRNEDDFEEYDFDPGFGSLGSLIANSTYTPSTTTTNLDRFGSCHVEEFDAFGIPTGESMMVALGKSGLFKENGGTWTEITGRGSYAYFSVCYDPNTKLIYTAEGEAGVSILAASGYPGGALVADYDVLAAFIPPTTQPAAWSDGFNVKDVATFANNYLSIAVGGTDGFGSPSKGGVYFVKKN